MNESRLILSAVVALAALAAAPSPGQSTFKQPSLEFAAQVERLLLDKSYAELETTAARLRRERPVFASGRLQILDFYEALSNVRGEDGLRNVRRADDRLQQLDAWHSAQPTITSRVALAGCLVEAAWAARGGGFADTITAQAVQKMSAAIARADHLLQEADRDLRSEKLDDPFLYYTWMRVGLLDGYDRPRMRELLDHALKCDPWFMPAVDEMCLHVLPRWYGKEGDLLRLADELAEQTRAETGETVYAIVALNALAYGEIQEFADAGFAWPRVRQGLRDWLQSAPDSTYRLGTLARLAHIANDRDAAREALDRLHGRWNTGVFPRRINFLRTERWAREQPSDSKAALVVEFGPIAILDAAFVEDGRVFVVGTRERALQLRSAQDGALLDEVPLESGRAELLATDPAGRFVVFTSPKREATRVTVLDLVSREQVELGTQTGRIRSLAVSSDQQFVVMSNDQGQLRRWEFGVRPIPYEWNAGHSDRFVTGVALAPDGKQLASAGGTQVKLWNLQTREELRTWNPGLPSARCLAWSPAAGLLAIGGHGNRVKLWSIEDAKELATLVGGNTSIQSLAFTRDGKRLVAGTMSAEQPQIPGEVLVWDVETKQLVKSFAGHRLGIWKVVVTADGRRIGSASDDGTVRIWQMP